MSQNVGSGGLYAASTCGTVWIPSRSEGTPPPAFYSDLWRGEGHLAGWWHCLWGRGGALGWPSTREDTSSLGSLTEMTLRRDPSRCVCTSSQGWWPQEGASCQ